MSKNNNYSMRFPSFLKSSAYLATFTAGAILLLCGCTDARKVAELQARIETLEKRQLEDGIKLAGMSEKIVTKAIEVGNIEANTIVLGEIESGFGHVIIHSSGIRLSTINSDRKTGAELMIDSSSIKIMDQPAIHYDSLVDGNGIVLSVKTQKLGSEKQTEETQIQLWSNDSDSEGKLWSRNLRTESKVDSERLFRIKDSDSDIYVIGAPTGHFAVRVISISDDGVVRLELANISGIAVGAVRGTVELVDLHIYPKDTRSQNKSASASFVIDKMMNPGEWFPVTVAFDVKIKELKGCYLKIKNLKAGSMSK